MDNSKLIAWRDWASAIAFIKKLNGSRSHFESLHFTLGFWLDLSCKFSLSSERLNAYWNNSAKCPWPSDMGCFITEVFLVKSRSYPWPFLMCLPILPLHIHPKDTGEFKSYFIKKASEKILCSRRYEWLENNSCLAGMGVIEVLLRMQ